MVVKSDCDGLGKNEIHMEFYWGNLVESGHLEDLDGSIILK
jgi:hypothetical protein